MEGELRKVSEFSRERSKILLIRPPIYPQKQDRLTTELKGEAEPKDLIAVRVGEEVVERGNTIVKTEACLITRDKIVIDERARWKCIIPLCFGYDSSPMRPPYR